MPKTKEKEIEQNFETLIAGDTRMDLSDLIVPGDTISINFPYTKGLALPGIALNYDHFSCVVPLGTDNRTIVALNQELRCKNIVKGEVDTRPKKDMNVLGKYIKKLDGNLATMRPAIIGLTTCVTKISCWIPKDILEEMRKYEQGHKNRSEIMKYIEEAIKNCRRTCSVDEDFDEKRHMTGTVVYNPKPKKFGPAE